MKENKYDEQKFFMKYSEMERSKKGLQGAGEWTELQKILPDFKDKKAKSSGFTKVLLINVRFYTWNRHLS